MAPLGFHSPYTLGAIPLTSSPLTAPAVTLVYYSPLLGRSEFLFYFYFVQVVHMYLFQTEALTPSVALPFGSPCLSKAGVPARIMPPPANCRHTERIIYSWFGEWLSSPWLVIQFPYQWLRWMASQPSQLVVLSASASCTRPWCQGHH